MRSMLRVAVGVSAVGLLAVAAAPSRAAAPAERSLFGIRIWRPWSEVLARFGQPTRIEVGAVTTGAPAGGAAAGGGMGMMGGPYGGPGGPMGMRGPYGGLGGPGAMGAGISGAPMGGLPGLSGVGGPPAGMMGPYGAMRRGAPGGMSGMGPGSPYGARGPMGPGGPYGSMFGQMSAGIKSGAGMGDEGLPGAGAPGAPGMGFGGIGAGAQPAETSEGEITWIYDRPGGNTMMFLFNKDGRVIQIQSFGYKNGGVTSRGVALGDPVSKVYRAYGWTDSTTKAGDSLTLDYSVKSHVAFQLLDRHDGHGYRVVGITVAQTEKPNG